MPVQKCREYCSVGQSKYALHAAKKRIKEKVSVDETSTESRAAKDGKAINHKGFGGTEIEEEGSIKMK
eukprot:8767203-Karenia_brevis.AAC.1